jgi:hypothetical protein
MKYFVSKSNRKHLKKLVLVIGGGSEIDKAKIYAKRNRMYCIAIPTTASGASETSHSVVWGKRKINIKTRIPISTGSTPFKIRLSQRVRSQTTLDCLGQLVDVLNVCSDNDLIEIGRQVGKWIEKYPTNLTHPMSYPLTLKYGVPHGFAVGLALKGLGIIK